MDATSARQLASRRKALKLLGSLSGLALLRCGAADPTTTTSERDDGSLLARKAITGNA